MADDDKGASGDNLLSSATTELADADEVGRQKMAGQWAILPDGWRQVQDHPKRGIVLEARPGTTPDPDATLEWMLAALQALTPMPLTGLWRATFYPRR